MTNKELDKKITELEKEVTRLAEIIELNAGFNIESEALLIVNKRIQFRAKVTDRAGLTIAN